MRHVGSRRNRLSLRASLLLGSILTGSCLFFLSIRSIEPEEPIRYQLKWSLEPETVPPSPSSSSSSSSSCATVEQMGEDSAADGFEKESLRVRQLIRHHFELQGAPRVRGLPPEQFCRQGFVMGKASEAGFGNEMYKILTGAALSVLLNRSLIIGQTRGKFPFEDYISYANLSFTLKEVKHLWRQNDCVGRFKKRLIMRTDDFEKPTETNVLCSDWREWKQPIIWFQGTTDAVGAQFFLKNIHPGMRTTASTLFGHPGSVQSRPNVFGELMRVIISPSQAVEEAVNVVLNGVDPDITLHMRMLMNRSVRAVQAALNCVKKAMKSFRHQGVKPRLVLVSDTPSFIKGITPNMTNFAEIIHFEYKLFKGNLSRGNMNGSQLKPLDFRVKDWGPAPRWVAFVDFFLASRAKHAVISGAHRRVGTTYAQLIAALAAAQQLGDNSSASKFSFFSSFQSNLLAGGLGNQVGWGHVWNRFAGRLSCHNQPHQCARTPLLPPAWWDAALQSPISRDIRRLQAYGVFLMDSGEVSESHLQSFCQSRKDIVKTMSVFRQCQNSKCS
ncbi:hypothetical protein AAC387_Pa08g2345 [Persea americana]